MSGDSMLTKQMMTNLFLTAYLEKMKADYATVNGAERTWDSVLQRSVIFVEDLISGCNGGSTVSVKQQKLLSVMLLPVEQGCNGFERVGPAWHRIMSFVNDAHG